MEGLLDYNHNKSVWNGVGMRVVLQRVTQGSVTIDDKKVAQIGPGLVILLGVGPSDTREIASAMADKVALLRIFEDTEGKMNLSIRDVQGEAIVVSQFTLYADTRKGRRPSFTNAAKPELAEPLVHYFAEQLRLTGVPTQEGVFGAHMVVNIENDGPVTIVIDLPQG
jgi:D-tyrosyl-tRNA(Tyr) deacylase